MNAMDTIRQLLVTHAIYTPGEAMAAQIYKGHGRDGFGWYVEPFGRTATYWGRTKQDAIDNLEAYAETFQQDN